MTMVIPVPEHERYQSWSFQGQIQRKLPSTYQSASSKQQIRLSKEGAR